MARLRSSHSLPCHLLALFMFPIRAAASDLEFTCLPDEVREWGIPGRQTSIHEDLGMRESMKTMEISISRMAGTCKLSRRVRRETAYGEVRGKVCRGFCFIPMAVGSH